VIVTCEQCTTQFHLDDSKVPEDGIRVRCSRCKHVFLVESPSRNDLDRVEELARDALDFTAPNDVESDWQFNEEVQSERPGPRDPDGRVAAEAAVDDLLGADLGPSRDAADEFEAGAGDSRATADDLDVGFGESGDSLDDLEADFGDPGDSMADFGSAFDLGGSDPEPEPEPDSHAGFDLQAPAAFEPELEPELDPDPALAADAGSFEDPADSSDLGRADLPPESGVGAAVHAADPAPVAAAATAAPDDEFSFELGDPEEWEEPEAPAPAPAPIRAAAAAIEQVPSSAPLESVPSPLASAPVQPGIDASALEADLDKRPGAARVAQIHTVLAWAAVSVLCAYAGFSGLLPTAPAPPSSGVRWSIAGMDVHAIEGRWIENAAAGPIYVVSGDLRVGSAGSPEPSTLLRVRLVDAAGDPIASASAAVGPPLPKERLREWNLRDLRDEQEKGARRLARTPLQRGERRPFLAVLGEVPPTAKGYEITRAE
jgi:predicted Zn finger-like uncharacterized protein